MKENDRRGAWTWPVARFYWQNTFFGWQNLFYVWNKFFRHNIIWGVYASHGYGLASILR